MAKYRSKVSIARLIVDAEYRSQTMESEIQRWHNKVPANPGGKGSGTGTLLLRRSNKQPRKSMTAWLKMNMLVVVCMDLTKKITMQTSPLPNIPMSPTKVLETRRAMIGSIVKKGR